ncbi:MAG: GNAT family N-acetyltransferase [Nitriliruptoraceae bacterium]
MQHAHLGVTLRAPERADVEAVLALNEADVPRVSSLDAQGLVQRIAWSATARVAVVGGVVAGFVLALPTGCDYDSPNYRFFSSWGTRWHYIDRVAVAAEYRRRGIATALYDAVEDAARADGCTHVTCEVNVDPPNRPSLAFHAARGFVPVGEQKAHGLTVRLLARPLGAD